MEHPSIFSSNFSIFEAFCDFFVRMRLGQIPRRLPYLMGRFQLYSKITIRVLRTLQRFGRRTSSVLHLSADAQAAEQGLAGKGDTTKGTEGKSGQGLQAAERGWRGKGCKSAAFIVTNTMLSCRNRRRGRCAPRKFHSQLVPRVIPRAAAEYLRYPHHALDSQCSSSKILVIRQGSKKIGSNWPTCLNS